MLLKTGISRLLLASLSSLLPFVSAIKASAEELTPQLKMTGAVVSQKYCYSVECHSPRAGEKPCSIEAEVFAAIVGLKIDTVNVSDRTAILAREMQPMSVWIAKTAEDADHGVFEATPIDWHSYFRGDEPIPTFAAKPDAERFVILGPGDSYGTTVQYRSVLVRRPAAKPEPAIVPTGAHVMRVNIDTWPYGIIGEKNTQSLRRRWNHMGVLSTGIVQTNFFPPFLPEDPKTESCDTR